MKEIRGRHVDIYRKRYPDVEFSEIASHTFPGYLNCKQMAARLDANLGHFNKWVKDGSFQPDLYNAISVFFSEKRAAEIEAKWPDRLTLSPASAPVMGVITPFGMMRPRVFPKREVLARLIQSRPKRASRDGSWKTRKRYNLADLES